MLGRLSHWPSIWWSKYYFDRLKIKQQVTGLDLEPSKPFFYIFVKICIKKLEKKFCSKFQNKFLKSSFLPKYDFINSFWNLQDNTFFLVCSTKKSWHYSSYKELYNTIAPGLKWFIQISNVSHGIPKIGFYPLTALNTLITGQSKFLEEKV